MRFTPACWLAAGVVLLGSQAAGAAAPPNGLQQMTATQILAAARGAVAQATTVHVVGGGSSGGTALSLDLRVIASKVGEGRITDNGLGFRIVRIGSKLFFKGDRKFLEHYAGAAGATLFAGKWFSVAVTAHDFASFASLTDLVPLVDGILAGHGKVEVGGTKTIDGQPAIALVGTTRGGTLYVATTGPAYPLELKPGKGATGVIRFTGWGAPVTVAPPKNALDYAKLTGH